MSFYASSKKINKNKTRGVLEQEKMFHITIEPWDNPQKGLWHFQADMDGKKGETVISKDWFKRAMADNRALIISVELFDDSIATLRDCIEKRDTQKIQAIVQNMTMQNTNQTNGFRRPHKNKGNNQIKASREFTDYLDSSVTTMKKQQNSNDVLQNISLALTLIKEEYKDVEEKINRNKKYQKHIPISSFPNLTEVQASKTIQWKNTLESFASIAGTFGKAFLSA